MNMYQKPVTMEFKMRNHLLLSLLLFLPVGLFTDEGLAQATSPESTHVTVSPVIGLPGDEVSLPIYLETAPGVEVGSIDVEITFPHNKLTFLNARQSFLATAAGGRLTGEVESRDDGKAQSMVRWLIETAPGESRRALPDGQLGFVAFEISNETPMSTKIHLETTVRVMDLEDPAGPVEPVVTHDGEITVGNLLFACFFYMH